MFNLICINKTENTKLIYFCDIRIEDYITYIIINECDN